jgi:hypothetical protein
MTDRSDLVRAVQAARGGQAIAQAVAALDTFDHGRVAAHAASRELDLGARIASERLTPVPLHERHSAATDWLGDYHLPADGSYRTAMIAEASTWYGGLDPAVRADGEELAEQARGRGRALASAYGQQAGEAQREFLQAVGYLHSVQGASGLPQVDQTVDPNNQPGPTPYPAEVFPTFAEDQDPFNGVEGPDHQSGASSQGAPLIQQVMQQDGSGSGYGTGPEKPDEHDTQFDTSNSYAEVPLGPPGQIGTAPAATDQMASSHPNPVAGTDQDAGAERRQALGHIDGYSLPDPFGYRWPMTTEVMHPFHERCASAHWPDEQCGSMSHVASVAVGYLMNLDDARRSAACEATGVREGLRAVTSSRTLADLSGWHNRFAAAWNGSGRTADDTAVLHGFMAVVRPVLAESAPRKACPACASGNCQNCTGGDCACQKCKAKNRKQVAAGKVASYVSGMAREYDAAPPGGREAAGMASRLDFREGVFDPDGDGDDDSTAAGDTDHDYFGTDGQPLQAQGASSLPQVQQVTDPNNVPSPQDDDLPEGVMFPISEGLAQQWVTGPGGAQPRGRQAARGDRLAPRAAEMFGRMDAMDGRQPQHQDEFGYSAIQHGRYLGGWNETAGVIHGMGGRAPLSRGEYEAATGRGDMHAHYLASYAQGRRMNQGLQPTAGRAQEDPEENRCSDCGHLPGCGCTHHCDNDPHTEGGYPRSARDVPLPRKQADTMTAPHATTDDLQAPYNSPATTPPQDQGGGDFAAGMKDGKADRAAGQRPAFADNSSGVSPYVKGYATGYGAPGAPQGQQDVPMSLGGDSGQGQNAQEAQRVLQVARASRAFAPPGLFSDRDFRRGYLFASRWRTGSRLVGRGPAAFEAGLYAGITDSAPVRQRAWLAAHQAGKGAHPELGRRIELHRSFTRKHARRAGLRVQGSYLRLAGTTTDLITDGPGTSPDPMGATPINGPGTPPPMGGLSAPAAPGGAPPYQGAPPLPGGPVVPDDVMGDPQQRPQPSGPFTNTFSGQHPENATLAPVAPNKADEPGYSNKDAYSGSPQGGDRLAAFRQRVQAGLVMMGAQQ